MLPVRFLMSISKAGEIRIAP